MKTHFFLVSFLGLAACGGGGGTGGGSSTLFPATGKIEIGNAGLAGSVPTGGGPVNITSNGTPIAGVVFDPALSTALFGAAQLTAGDNTFNVVAFSDDGTSAPGQSANISADVIGTSAATGEFGQVASYARTGTTLMPVSGTGTYTGEYRGTYGSQTTGILGSATGGLIAVVGTASVPINFATSSISGAMITDRTPLVSNGPTLGTFADVMLGNVTFNSSGVFSGAASGGLNDFQSTLISLPGSRFEGLVGGPNGNAVAGAILLNSQDLSGAIFTEVGAFTAVRP